MRLLLVEDDPALADAVLEVLRDESYAVDRAANGRDADELVAINDYDLVILDPPYADAAIPDTLRQLSESALVQSGSVVVLGHWPRLELPDRIGTLQLLKRRCHGDSCFSILEAV